MIALKRKNQNFLLANNSGQAAVEYILMLVISVSVIVGLIYQFNKDFKTYADNYFGNYLKCLIISGELPTLGNENVTVSNSSCQDKFKAFTLTEGRPSTSDSNSNGTSSGRANSSSGSSGKKSFRSNARGSGSRSGSNQSGGSGSKSASASSDSAESDKENTVEGGGSTPRLRSADRFKTGDRIPTAERRKQIAKFETYKPKNKKKGKTSVKVRKLDNQDENQSSKKSFRMQASIKKTKVDKLEVNHGFGNYLRYLIIAAILIILLVIVGGQVLSAKKGAE